jgi:hypothetical protein
MIAEPLDPNQRFRMRREEARRRQKTRRALAVGALTLVVAGSAAAGVKLATARQAGTAASTGRGSGAPAKLAPRPTPRPLPSEMRGVHVTMALVWTRGKMHEYFELAHYGLNTLEVDVKDENGRVAFPSADAPLAARIHAAVRYYDPRRLARAVHRRGLYLVGRIVVFEDPLLSTHVPRLAIHRKGGGIWRNSAGLGWTNPYDKRVWKYNVDVARSAANAGFDEIMFDYVRFPSDGDIESAVYKPRSNAREPRVIASFLRYARRRLHPLGTRVGAAVFGLSATRDLGIGQRPRRISSYLDVIHPMVYPSHYGSGEYDLPDPEGDPGDTVWFSLRDFAKALGDRPTRLVPWLQDFSLNRTYSLADVQAQIKAARAWKSSGYLLWNADGIYTPAALRGP